MDVQITDYSANGSINRTERYSDGTTVQITGTEFNNYFNAQVVTSRIDGYRLTEQVSGNSYNGGASNIQRRTISEQLPYAQMRLPYDAPRQFNITNGGAVR